jgi:hypothetical protein
VPPYIGMIGWNQRRRRPSRLPWPSQLHWNRFVSRIDMNVALPDMIIHEIMMRTGRSWLSAITCPPF